MKAEHRHELQTNELGKVVDSVGGIFDTYGNQIMIGICAAAIAVSATIYWVRRSNDLERQAWAAMADANSPEAFAEIIDRYPKASAAPWARLQAAESRLAKGIQLMFTDREAALVELKGTADRPKCLEDLQALVAEQQLPSEIRERALFGLARCQETISDGNEAAAIETYETLLRQFPETIYKARAEDSIAALKKGSAQEFYAWFAKQNPKPAPPPKKPADNKGGSMPDADDFERLAPSGPTKKKPATDEDKTTDEPSSGPALPAPADPGKADAPAEDKEKPKADASKDDTSKDDAPKEDAPKDESPKEEKSKPEAPKPDAPDADASKPDAPKPDAPKADESKPEAPEKDAPGDDTPKAKDQSDKPADTDAPEKSDASPESEKQDAEPAKP